MDIHVYVNKILILVVECKSYVDSCFYKRALDDIRIFKEFSKIPPTGLIFALEDGMSDTTKIWYDHYTKQACDGLFCILDGKRSSERAIYKEGMGKSVNPEKLNDFLEKIGEILLRAQERPCFNSISV